MVEPITRLGLTAVLKIRSRRSGQMDLTNATAAPVIIGAYSGGVQAFAVNASGQIISTTNVVFSHECTNSKNPLPSGEYNFVAYVVKPDSSINFATAPTPAHL